MRNWPWVSSQRQPHDIVEATDWLKMRAGVRKDADGGMVTGGIDLVKGGARKLVLRNHQNPSRKNGSLRSFAQFPGLRKGHAHQNLQGVVEEIKEIANKNTPEMERFKMENERKLLEEWRKRLEAASKKIIVSLPIPTAWCLIQKQDLSGL